jgi:hypothetical protein
MKAKLTDDPHHATLGVAGEALHQLYGRHNVACSFDLWNAVAAHIPAVAAVR